MSLNFVDVNLSNKEEMIMKIKSLFSLIVLVFGLLIHSRLFAQKFDFNDGTKQGWTMVGAYDESLNGPYPSNFTLGWTKLVNYPTPDISSTKGALLFSTSGGHGITGSSGTYWIMQFHSPDLSSNANWQSATGFTVRIVENMTVGSTLYANLIVTVYDYDQSIQRSFYNDSILNQSLTYSSWFNSNAVWNYLTFDWSNIPTFPTNYRVDEIYIQILGTMSGYYEGQVGIDEVVAQTAAGPTSSITVITPNGGEQWEAGTQQTVSWTGQGIDNYDVKIEYSTNNGATYAFVDYETNHGTSGSYTWTVPNVPSAQCLVRLSVLLPPEIYDVSDGVFEITQPSQPFSFEGYVYQGYPPDISTPVGSIKVKLYGDDDEWPESGIKVVLDSTTTDGSGAFNLDSGSGNSNYNYYHVIETDPAGAISVGAQAGHPGYVKNFNCISYENATLTPGSTYSGSAFWDIQSSAGNTPTGIDVSVILSDDVSITFDEVTAAGNTTLETSHIGPEPPDNLVVHPYSNPLYYDINATASYSGLVHLTIHYDDTEIDADTEYAMNIFKYIQPSSEWLGITTSVDIDNDFIYGTTNGLSIFAMMYQTGSTTENELIVTNCDDSSPGSLNSAILYANSNPGVDTIRFQIPEGVPGYDSGTGVWTIAPLSNLPIITDSLVIDGFSQKTFIGEDTNPFGPEIWLNGEIAAPYQYGLMGTAGAIEIFGLTISNFDNAGIGLFGVDGGRISGCYLGTDYSGNAAAGNDYGIWLGGHSQNVIIAPYDTFKNVISGNFSGGIGVRDTSSHVIIQENIIGLSQTGTYSIGNGDYEAGIFISGHCDSVDVLGNWIGGNKHGILIYGSSHIALRNNLIGLNKIHDEILELGNEGSGITFTEGAHDNLITENFIRFNHTGIWIYGIDTIHNRVSRNHISGNWGMGGIVNESGGNLELAPPVISSVSSTSVSGTAIPNATVEIYTDPENQGLIFQGETSADAGGNFTWNGTITGPHTNVTAIAIDESGNTSMFSQAAVITHVENRDDSNIPKRFSLSQNVPNPFNPQTTIRYEITSAGNQKVKVELHIYNMQGQLIRTLVNEEKSPGVYEAQWNGMDEADMPVAAGIYLYRIFAGEYNNVKKMILIN